MINKQFTANIEKLENGNYRVVTNVPMTYGASQRGECRLVGQVLKTFDSPGKIRLDCGFRINLGPASFAKVNALSVGQSVEVN